MTAQWKEGYLAALEDTYVAIVARGLWSVALDQMLEDLRQDAMEIDRELVVPEGGI